MQQLTPRDEIQAKVYTRWINHHGEKARKPVQVNNMADDLVSGEIMCLLAEIFVPKGGNIKFAENPKNKLQRSQNHSSAFSRFEADGAQLLTASAQTLAEDDKDKIELLKIYMGYVFQLILRYSVGNDSNADLDEAEKKKQKSLAELKRNLIDWVNEKLATLTPDQCDAVRKHNGQEGSDEIRVQNLDSDWQDGTKLTGLCIALHPEDKRQNGLNKLANNVSNQGQSPLSSTITRSHTNLQVPQLMQAEDFSTPDQNSILTYVSAFKNANYIDDSEPEVETAKIEWDEPTFLQIEVDALEKRDITSIEAQKDIIQSKLDEVNQNKAEGKVYEDRCERLAVRMALHLRRVLASIANYEADANANEEKSKKSQDDLKKAQDELDAANKSIEDEQAKAKKIQDELDAANQSLEDEKTKSKKLQDDLDAANKELAKLRKRQSKLEELQKALLVCATISDEMAEELANE